MSILSDLIEEILQDKDIKISQLAKMTGISRATLHHYVHGQRPIQKKEHFDAIVHALTLSPLQTEKMEEAYQIESIGETLFIQQQQVDHFFRNLGTIQDCSMLDKNNLSVFQDDSANEEKSVVIVDSNRVSLAIYTILNEASRIQDTVMLYADPLSPCLEGILNSPSLSNNASEIYHIFRLDASSNHRRNKNFQVIGAALKYAAIVRKYNPMYYYEAHTDEETMFQLTDFIISSQEVLIFSKTGEYAIRHTGKDFVGLFHTIFQKMIRKCRFLGRDFNYIINTNHAFTKLKAETSNRKDGEFSVIGVSGTVAISNIWTEEKIRTYLRKDLPTYETLVEMLINYSQFLKTFFNAYRVIYVMKKESLKNFINTGTISSYHPAFAHDCISETDRILIARMMIQAIEESTVGVALIESDVFPMPEMWDGIFLREEMILFNYNNRRCTHISLDEPSLTYAAFEYFENLIKRADAIKGKDAVEMIRKWVKEYLNETFS